MSALLLNALRNALGISLVFSWGPFPAGLSDSNIVRASLGGVRRTAHTQVRYKILRSTHTHYRHAGLQQCHCFVPDAPRHCQSVCIAEPGRTHDTTIWINDKRANQAIQRALTYANAAPTIGWPTRTPLNSLNKGSRTATIGGINHPKCQDIP